jgi:hypothetical protein
MPLDVALVGLQTSHSYYPTFITPIDPLVTLPTIYIPQNASPKLPTIYSKLHPLMAIAYHL